uniref:Uncharacterized protein n=1 Tax=Anguilla anguilla TaxID=7936 RepID=A0A0E9SQQ4_ANGAN
MHSAGPRFCI